MTTLTEPEPLGVGPSDLANAERMERALIAACIRSGETDSYAVELASEVVKVDHLGHHAHRAVYRAILDAHAAGEPPTADLLHLAMEQAGTLADLSPNPGLWFADILEEFPPGADAYVRLYASKVADLAARRRLKRAAVAILREADAPGPAAEVQARAEALVFEAADGSVGGAGGLRSAGDMVRESLDGIRQRASGTGPTGLLTGLGDIDRYLSGLRPGQVCVIAARPSVGKTALALRMFLNATATGVPALFFSMEMSESELMSRALSMRSNVPLWAIDQGRLTDAQMGSVRDAGAALAQEPMHLDPNPDLTPARFAAELRRAVRRHGVRFAVVDYVGLMRPTNPRDNRNNQVGEAARAVKLAAMACGAPVLLLAQLNREVEHRDGGRPRLSDLRDSGEVEQHADIVLLLHPQPDQPVDAAVRLIDVLVAKNRNGPRGEVTLQYTGPVVRFDNAPCGPG